MKLRELINQIYVGAAEGCNGDMETMLEMDIGFQDTIGRYAPLQAIVAYYDGRVLDPVTRTQKPAHRCVLQLGRAEMAAPWRDQERDEEAVEVEEPIEAYYEPPQVPEVAENNNNNGLIEDRYNAWDEAFLAALRQPADVPINNQGPVEEV